MPIQDVKRQRRKYEIESSCHSVAVVKKKIFSQFFAALWTASPTVRQPPAGWLCGNNLASGGLSHLPVAHFLLEADQTCDVTARGPR